MCSRRRRSLRGLELYVGDVWVKVILGRESWPFTGRWGVRRLGPRSRFLSRMHGHRGPEPRSVRAWSARSGTAQSADPTPGAVCSAARSRGGAQSWFRPGGLRGVWGDERMFWTPRSIEGWRKQWPLSSALSVTGGAPQASGPERTWPGPPRYRGPEA